MSTSTPIVRDPAHDFLRAGWQPLDAIFKPRSVAVVGATEREGSVGRTILRNLLATPFGGTVYPINPSRSSVLGIRAYKSLRDVPEPIELAVIITPAETVPGVLSECVDLDIPGGIVISAGFKEVGERGKELERQIAQQLARGRMRIIGPNCLGVMNPLNGLNATFANGVARPGNVAFISQSGALCTSILDWSYQEMVGFSAFVSTGSMLDIDWGDLIYYLGNDPRTESIVIYMESIGNARSFLSAAREVALTKPIIVIKAGRTEAAAKAAASHTGSLTGSDEVLDAAFRRVGVLRVNNISDLFYMAEVLAKQPRAKGPRLVILTNAGGPGVLATDALIADGGELADISEETMAELNSFLPSHWSHGNPVDILGDAGPERTARALEVVAKDPNCDGMIVVMSPQGMTNPPMTAELLKPYAKSTGKPVFGSFMGGTEMASAIDLLNRYDIPTFAYPDTGVRMFNYMWKHDHALRALYETPTGESGLAQAERNAAEQIILNARSKGRTLLTEAESKQLLEAYGIPTTPTRVATTEDEAARTAGELGYPIVLKLHSETITHKTDVGGVILNLRDEAAVRAAYKQIEASVAEKAGREHFLGVTVQPMAKLDGYEIILGSSIDPQFGPVLLFGSGGQLVEVFKDRALGLPPLNTTLARRMMERTKILTALKGVRGRKPVDIAALEQLMVRFSQLVVEQRWIAEIDINPLLASPDRLLALDARVVLHPLDMKEEDIPKPAIRPYPIKYVKPFTSKTGEEVMIRPIRPEDEPLIVRFHEMLSERTVYQRYFSDLHISQRTAHERLTRICFIDYNREMTLVAERMRNGQPEIVGVGRLRKMHGFRNAEMTLIVIDEVQRQGVGSELLNRIITVAKNEKIVELHANMLRENTEMQAVVGRFGFEVRDTSDPKTVRAVKKL